MSAKRSENVHRYYEQHNSLICEPSQQLVRSVPFRLISLEHVIPPEFHWDKKLPNLTPHFLLSIIHQPCV